MPLDPQDPPEIITMSEPDLSTRQSSIIQGRSAIGESDAPPILHAVLPGAGPFLRNLLAQRLDQLTSENKGSIILENLTFTPREMGMSKVRLAVGTRKGAFILTSNE